MAKTFTFSSESVGEGHPDKVADLISDSILDVALSQDPLSHVACQTIVKSNHVFLVGEITSHAQIDFVSIVKDTLTNIGYTDATNPFNPNNVIVHNHISKQSLEIAHALEGDELGAGDQGIIFGYACNHTPQLLPAPILFAHLINQQLAAVRKSEASFLKPDCKSQVAVEFVDNVPHRIDNVVVSTQHAPEISLDKLKDFVIQNVIKKCLPLSFLDKNTEFIINPGGTFISGGPEADAGLTGRKNIVDTYGGWSRNGGGALSGKDPTKVDRSAAYMARWAAKNIVAAGLAEQVEIQVAYAIGRPAPTSFYLNTFNTSKFADDLLKAAVLKTFSFRPFNIIHSLSLLYPLYAQTTNYGHFNKPNLPWEQTNKTNELLDNLMSLS